MPDSTIKEYQELSEKLDSSKAAIFSKSLKGFHAHYYIYVRNYEDLVNFINSAEQIGHHLTAVETPSDESNLRKTYKEAARLVFNFLSSAKARIDYTRCFINENYKNTSVFTSYENYIVENFGNDELSIFLNDLRNYFLHKGIPSIGIKVNWSESKAHIYIDKEKIVDSSSWKQASKSFLSKYESEIILRPLIIEYGEKVYAQANWIIDELYKFHSSDIDEYKDMKAELDGILAKLNST